MQKQKQRPQEQTKFKTQHARQNKNNPSFRVVNNNKNAKSNNKPFPQAGDRTCKALPFEDPYNTEFPCCTDTKANQFDCDGKGYILTFQMMNQAKDS
jgi:hypothetical protein